AIFLATEDGVEVGGRVSLSGSVETRLDIGWNFEVTGFYDVGSVTESFDAVGRETFRDAVGMGLRYITPIGPIGFLYGIKLDRRPEEGFGRLHFALGYTF
ncbi:MAG: outer membrane protein assembly factor BamA, partial [Deltaproteobacteria bacterium]